MRSLKLFLSSLSLAGLTIVSTTTGADAAEVNFGCIPRLAMASGLSPSTQAPGQVGNGPLVIHKNGTIITASPFGGSTGC